MNKRIHISNLAMSFGFAALLQLTSSFALAVDFVDAQSSKPLKIDPALFNTEQAKKFLSSGQNPYSGNQEAIASGKKLFQLYSCTQCHGGNAQGQTAVGLSGPNYVHPRSANDKGMFEIIWNGTNGGMGGKGKGVMDPGNPQNGMSPDEILKTIAWIRSTGSKN